ncbi:MAG: hypothetical protein JXN61_01330, partial [Sedimentisphaerales bacterium]|nr:hypothetical protein [Sedimentisphaerales bacterium]
TDSPLIEAASTVIAQMKDKGLAGLLDNKNRQSLFLIRDSRKRIIGFTTDILIDTGGTSELNIEAMGLYYTRGLFPREEMTSFQSDNRFDRFTWKTESVAAERSGVEIALKDDGLLTITKSHEPDREISYHTGNTAVPEILLEQLLAQIINSDIQETLVDVITSNGRIIPTHIYRIKPEDTATEQNVPAIKLTPVSGRGFYQLIYLDSQKKISRTEQQSLERIEDRYYFDRTEPEDAARLFPERSEFILQRDKLRQYLDKMI